MKNKKNLMFIGIATITLIVVVLGATYAYFVAQGGSSANTNVDVQTNTTDNLSFEVGNPITLNINQDNFYQGAGNQAGSTTASATLTANNATNNATANYYLYLDITSNNFEYTVDTDIPELILTITAPDGTELQTLSGYKYVEVGDVSGFDITTVSDVIKIAENYEITSTGTETQTWNITVTFVNLDSDQVDNTGKSFEASLIIQDEPLQTKVNFVSYITDILYKEDGINGLYYHDGIGDYVNTNLEAKDNSYRYSGANPNNFVCFGNEQEQCPEDNLYRVIGIFNNQVKLIKSDFATASSLGEDGDYSGNTFTSSDYVNYKGSETYIDRFYWNRNSINDWSISELNKINLNTNYLNSFDLGWQDLITNTIWQVGGGSHDNFEVSTNAQIVHTYEVGANTANITYTAKVGLMYVSDYYYAAEAKYWSYSGYATINMPDSNGNYGEDYDYRAAINDNWMYSGIHELTISRLSDYTTDVFDVYFTGNIGNSNVNGDIFNGIGVRPVFYLNTDVQIYEGHAGTVSDPYRIVI